MLQANGVAPPLARTNDNHPRIKPEPDDIIEISDDESEELERLRVSLVHASATVHRLDLFSPMVEESQSQ